MEIKAANQESESEREINGAKIGENPSCEPRFGLLEHETRPGVETAAAAYYLNRKEQTLRSWACAETGPIRPRRINGRLFWPTARLRELVGLEAI